MEEANKLIETEKYQIADSLRLNAEHARRFAEAARSPNTRKAYRTDWSDFEGWCAAHRLQALPATPESVALYLTHLTQRGLKVSTMQRRLASISQAHQLAGHASPTTLPAVREVMKGIRRELSTAPSKKKALTLTELRGLAATCGTGLQGRRDRAMLLIGFLGALRRSELVALNIQDVIFEDEGLRLLVARSKTDQDGHGRELGLPASKQSELCPVLALRAWCESARISSGPIFRRLNRSGNPLATPLTPHSVALIIKRHASQAGLDPGRFAGHSLRAGFCTAAARAGIPEYQIARQSGHRSMQVLRGYVQSGGVFLDNAAGKLGL
jgi:integrase